MSSSIIDNLSPTNRSHTVRTIANFAYAGTDRYVSHAINGEKTYCGLVIKDLLARSEWEEIDQEENYLGHRREPVRVGCKRCSRSLEKQASTTSVAEKVVA
jgi:hypothetical protein